jgi:hypothetical protein
MEAVEDTLEQHKVNKSIEEISPEVPESEQLSKKNHTKMSQCI